MNEIRAFAAARGATFPIFDKLEVNGPGQAPLYALLKTSRDDYKAGFVIEWNYAKFVVDSDGRPVGRYGSATSPLEAEPLIKKLLKLD